MQQRSHFQENPKESGARQQVTVALVPGPELEGGPAPGWTMQRLSPHCHQQQLATANKLMQGPSESLTPMQYS